MKGSSLHIGLAACALLATAQAQRDGKEGRPASIAPYSAMNRPLSKVEALNIAIAQNGTILQARSDLKAEYGVAIQTKAIVFPQVTLAGTYSVRQDSLVEENRNRRSTTRDLEIVVPGFTALQLEVTEKPPRLDNNQAWNSGIQIVQSIYEGGRLQTAVHSSRLLRERAMLVYQSTVADTLLEVSVSYDDTLRDAKLVDVQAAAVKLYGEFVTITKDKQQAGVITTFDVLRSEVELANNEALLVQAQGTYRTTKQRFVAILGYDLPTTVSDNLSLDLTSPLVARPFPGDLHTALAEALQNRSEIAALGKEVALREDAVINARSGYKPSVQAFAGYDLTSDSQARNAGDPNYGALVGAQVSWRIFDGFLTRGQVDQAVALRGKAGEAKAETTRRVELQVRSNWSDLRTARAVLDAQAQNIDQAVQALKLSQARYQEGAGTQIDVFSAQTALTESRGSYVTALRDYSVAYARLLRAIGRNLKNQGPAIQ